MRDQPGAIDFPREFALPRRALAPWVKNLIGGAFGLAAPHLPASPDAQLVVYLRGGATIVGEPGVNRLPAAFLSGPTLAPRRFTVEPGSSFMSAVFRPAGVLHCFGVPADCLKAAPVPLDSIAGQGAVADLQDALHHAQGFRARVRILEDFLLRRPGAVTPLPQLSFERLFLPVDTLAEDYGLGVRQFERRFLAHHGVALRDYRRLARFALALSNLMRAQGRPTLAQAALDAGYVDQAHFSRDFRQFVGDTPSGYLSRRDDSASGYGFWQFGSEELDSFLR